MKASLSRRQIVVGAMIANGFTIPEIAEILGSSVSTVRQHRDRLMTNLDMRGPVRNLLLARAVEESATLLLSRR